MKRSGGVSDDFKRVELCDCPMSTCAAPAGSPCRTGKGKVAIQYHAARFRLVPQLAKALSVPTPAVRKPGSVWTELPRPVSAEPNRSDTSASVTHGPRPPGSPSTRSSTPSPRPE
ncbi:zinc finger domain-containing protein [Streptomyces rhizosphaerihabitans]